MTATLNRGARLSDTPVTVSVGGGTSTATAGTDFATVSDFTVTIAAGTLSQTATFTLEPTDDDVDEGYFESVAVSGTSTVSALSSVIGTAVNILDDDDRGVTVSVASLTVNEGSTEHLHGGAGFGADRRCDGDAVEIERGRGRDGERCADFYAGQLVERACPA